MKILHIIPSAFDYFDDIKDKALALAGAEQKLGAEVVAYTIQYGSVTSSQKQAVEVASQKSLVYQTTDRLDEIFQVLPDYDVVHIHLPILGFAYGFLQAIKSRPERPVVVVSYWRTVPIMDLMSLYIYFYNQLFIPKILAQAEMIITHVESNRQPQNLKKFMAKTLTIDELRRGTINENIHLTLGSNQVKLSQTNTEAEAFVFLYNKLTNL